MAGQASGEARAWLPVAIILLLASAWVPRAQAIVNGTLASEARFAQRYPWAVALVSRESGGVCTGELIAPTWVLTAAHCASTDMEARTGASDRNQARAVKVLEAVRHPRYDGAAGTWDVGLLRLAEPVAAPVLATATAADGRQLLREAATAIIAGWGRRSASTGFSDRLVESEVELRELRREESRFIYVDRASGPCGGDSGGPLLLRRADGRQVLAGVASRVVGDLCAAGGGISVYADAAAVRPFIESHVPGLAH